MFSFVDWKKFWKNVDNAKANGVQLAKTDEVTNLSHGKLILPALPAPAASPISELLKPQKLLQKQESPLHADKQEKTGAATPSKFAGFSPPKSLNDRLNESTVALHTAEHRWGHAAENDKETYKRILDLKIKEHELLLNMIQKAEGLQQHVGGSC